VGWACSKHEENDKQTPRAETNQAADEEHRLPVLGEYLDPRRVKLTGRWRGTTCNVQSSPNMSTIKSCDCSLCQFRTPVSSLRDFRTFFRELRDPITNRFTRQTLPTVRKKCFFMNILFTDSFCPQYYTPSTVAVLTTETNL
jgi:hypothetical protein